MKKIVCDRPIKLAFLIGGIYDIMLGLGLLFFVDLLADILDASKPEPKVFAHLMGLFLITVGYYLLFASQDPRRLAFIGAGSTFIRFIYAFLVLLAWITQKIETIYLLTALTDVITGLILLSTLLLTEGVAFKQLWQFQPSKGFSAIHEK